jgi:hypothetical protein
MFLLPCCTGIDQHALDFPKPKKNAEIIVGTIA